MRPRPPLEGWDGGYYDPRFGFAWYCGRGIVVSQTTVEHAGEAPTIAYLDYEGEVLRKYADEVWASSGLYVVHDWRTLIHHSASGRRVWLERMRARPKGYLRGSVVCLTQASALLRMAVQGVNLFTSITYGIQVELTTDIEGALDVQGLLTPTFKGLPVMA